MNKRSFPIAIVATSLLLVVCSYVVFAAVSFSIITPYVQNFDGMGIPATATTASTLPADFKVDNPATVRTVGSYAAALTATARAGGASLSTSAANGIYSFGSGAATLGGADRAIGFLSSGTATASGNLYAQFVNNSGGDLTGLQISYNVEKYRGGSNAAGFRFQLFYSTDGATWTNAGGTFLTSFGADANNNGFATAPGVGVPVSGTLNVAVPAASSFYLAWNYSVASGATTTNAQALAIDDISILAVPGSTPTNPSATGAANPSSVQAGTATLLTVTVTPGLNPTSTGVAVSADLTAIGGSPTQAFFDDGTHGDAVSGDNVFSFQATVPVATSTGAKVMAASVLDGQGRPASASISLTVTPSSTPPTGAGLANPASLQAGVSTLLTVTVTPGSNPVSSGLGVVGDLITIGGGTSQVFFNDGSHGDATAGDNVFSFETTVTVGTSPGGKSLSATISDAEGRTGTATIALTVLPPPPPTTVKISQVYGGGGNSGATYTNDFIEIFNQDISPIDITGWSVQYKSAGTAGSWVATPLCPSGTCSLAAGHYFLVQESQGAGGTTSLPTPDALGSIAMSGTNAKVALVNGPAVIAGDCPALGTVADLVGYGSASCFESAATAGLSNTTAAVRKGNGCVDTDSNVNDFVTIGPIPRNSAAPANSCGGDPSRPSGLGLASPASLLPAANALLTVRVTPATTPPSTGLAVSADLALIGGAADQAFYDDGTHGDLTAGDGVFSFQQTVGPFIQTGVKYMVALLTDAEGRRATAPITLTIESPTCGVERWSIKVGTDPTVGFVDVSTVIPTSVEVLGLVTPPDETALDTGGPLANARSTPVETTVYSVDATVTFFKRETDVDYHIVLDDGHGHTLISEIPSPACIITSTAPRVLVPSPLSAGIANAREKFDARLTATTFFQTVAIPVRVTGVGFFDFEHGQTGVAPNAIELHPVLDISFRGNTVTTLGSSLNPSQFGQLVTFTAVVSNDESSTPTGNVTFFDAGDSFVAALDATGTARFTTAALSAGTHTISASYEGDATALPSVSTPVAQVVSRADQTIDFGALAGKTFGDADFTVSGGASSGLPVTFAIVSGPATISGSTVHITGAGDVTVRASQPGNSNYNAAPDVDRMFVVAQASQTITFAGLTDKTFGDPAFPVSASGGASGNPVTLAASGSCAAGGVNGSTITLTGIGVCAVTASQAGSANYAPAADVTRTFRVFDRTAPAIGTVTPSVTSIWPPNNKMVPVSFRIDVTDDVDAAPSCQVIGVTSNEGSSADWQITGPTSVDLRADRAGSGSGRIYVITVRCTDASGNASTATAVVSVPHDQGK